MNAPDTHRAFKAILAATGPDVIRPGLPMLFRENALSDNKAVAVNLATRFTAANRSTGPFVKSMSVHFHMDDDSGDNNKDSDTELEIRILSRVNNHLSAETPPYARSRLLANSTQVEFCRQFRLSIHRNKTRPRSRRGIGMRGPRRSCDIKRSG